jgi:hypothetical protein
MAKPTIVTRAGKGSALTWTEGDANVTNLRDATVSIKAGSAGVSVSADLNSEIVLVAGSNITLTGDNTAKTITVAASQPTSVATLTTPRAIYGNSFDGSAALTQVIASTYGGTGNGFTKFSGPTTAEKTFTLPDASSTILVSGGALGTPSGGTVTNLTGTASININGTVGATTRAAGSFTTLTADTTTLDDIRETVYAIGNSSTSTLTPDAANGSVQTITATGNFTLSAFSNPVSGQTITFIITQDGTGSRTLTSTMKFAGGSKTLSTAASSIDIMTVSYIGTTYYASLSKAFA